MTFARICEILDHLDDCLDDDQILSILHSFNENQTPVCSHSLPHVRQHAILGGFVCTIA